MQGQTGFRIYAPGIDCAPLIPRIAGSSEPAFLFSSIKSEPLLLQIIHLLLQQTAPAFKKVQKIVGLWYNSSCFKVRFIVYSIK